MEGEGMVAVVRGLRDAGLAVTLLDGSRQYTLLPNSITQPPSTQRAPVTSTHASTQPCPPKCTADSSTESSAYCDRDAQATDGRYASTYKTVHCNVRPTSPPVQLTEFPPQRPDVYPGHGNFQVGGAGSGATYSHIRASSPVTSFRGGLSWPDRGSVCSPRPSHEVDAFANSLRKYPCLSPDRSSEVMERLINYAQAKGLTKTSTRNLSSPTRIPEHTFHTLEPKGTYTRTRSYEPEITVRSKRVEDPPTRDRKKDDQDTRALRSFDVRCIRDMSKRMRESVRAYSSYPYNHPVCPTIKENHDFQPFSHEYQNSSNSVNMEIQAAVKMISKEVATVPRKHLTRKTVAVPESPISSAGEDNVEGECYFVPNLDINTSFKSIQTNLCPSDITLKPRKSAQTVCSTMDLHSRRNRTIVGRKTRSQELIKVTKEELKSSLLELMEEVSNTNKSKKIIRDELIRKLFVTDRSERDDNNGDRGSSEHNKCHKYVSTFCPSGCDYVGDFQELVGKLRHCYGDKKHVIRSEISPFRISEYRHLDFVLKDWINNLNIKNRHIGRFMDRGEIINSVEDRIKELFKNRTEQDFDLKSGIVKIIEEIPIEVNKSYDRKSYLNKLVEVLLKRMRNVIVSQQSARIRRRPNVNRWRKILTKDNIRDFVRAYLLEFFNEYNLGLSDETLDDLENELIDVMIDSIDCIRCGHVDDAMGEMDLILQDLGQVTDKQANYISNIILQDLQEMLNNCNFNQTYMILNFNNHSGRVTNKTNNTDVSIEAITDEDLRVNLDHYTNQLCQHINQWLDTLNIPQIQDRGFREVVVNDLAGDILDRNKYIELNHTDRGTEEDELEALKYQIFKWINKLVGDDNYETIGHAKSLLEKINTVPIPMLTNPKYRKMNNTGTADKPQKSFDPMRPCLGETGPNTCKEENLKLTAKRPCCLKDGQGIDCLTEGPCCEKVTCPKVAKNAQSTSKTHSQSTQGSPGLSEPLPLTELAGQGPQSFVNAHRPLLGQGSTGSRFPNAGQNGYIPPGSYGQDFQNAQGCPSPYNPGQDSTQRSVNRPVPNGQVVQVGPGGAGFVPPGTPNQKWGPNGYSTGFGSGQAGSLSQTPYGNDTVRPSDGMGTSERLYGPIDPNQQSMFDAGSGSMMGEHPKGVSIPGLTGPIAPGYMRGNFNSPSTSFSPFTYSSGSQVPVPTLLKNINEEYDNFVKQWVQQIPIAANTPEEQQAADKARLGVYNGVWKSVTKMKLDPEIFCNPYYYQDVFDEEMEGLMKGLPKSQELDAAKPSLKAQLLQKTLAMNDQIRSTNAPASFKQQLTENIEINLPKRTHTSNEYEQQIEELEKQTLADYYILHTNYKYEDNVKANVHKKNFLKKLDEFLEKIKKRHGIVDMDTNAYAKEIINSLDKIPTPNEPAIRNEADDILLGMEVDNWIFDLPKQPDTAEPFEKRRIRDSIVKKIQQLGTDLNYSDASFAAQLKAELPKYLVKIPLKERTNVDYMVEELTNRIKNLSKFIRPKSVSFSETCNYEEFSKNLPAASSFNEPSDLDGSSFVTGGNVRVAGSNIWAIEKASVPQEEQWHSMEITQAPSGLRNWSEGPSMQSQVYSPNILGQIPTPDYPSGGYGVQGQFAPNIQGQFTHNGQGQFLPNSQVKFSPSVQGGPIPDSQVCSRQGVPCCLNQACTNRPQGLGVLSQYGQGFSNAQMSPIPHGQDSSFGNSYGQVIPGSKFPNAARTSQIPHGQGSPGPYTQSFGSTSIPGPVSQNIQNSFVPGSQMQTQVPHAVHPGQGLHGPYGQGFPNGQDDSVSESQMHPQGLHAGHLGQGPHGPYGQKFPNGQDGSVKVSQMHTQEPHAGRLGQGPYGTYGQTFPSGQDGSVKGSQMHPQGLHGGYPGQVPHEPYGQGFPNVQYGSLQESQINSQGPHAGHLGQVPHGPYGQGWPNGKYGSVPGSQMHPQIPRVSHSGQVPHGCNGQGFRNGQDGFVPRSQMHPQGPNLGHSGEVSQGPYGQGFPNSQGGPVSSNQGQSFGPERPAMNFLASQAPYAQTFPNIYGQVPYNNGQSPQTPYGEVSPNGQGSLIPEGQMPYQGPNDAQMGQVYRGPYGQALPNIQGSPKHTGQAGTIKYNGQSYSNGYPNASTEVQSSMHSPTVNQTAQSSGPISATSQIPDTNNANQSQRPTQEMAGGGMGVLGSQEPGPSSTNVGQTQNGRAYQPSATATNATHPGFYKSTDSKENQLSHFKCGTIQKEQPPKEPQNNKLKPIDNENETFNIKSVQTAFSTIDIKATKCKYYEIRSKSQEELTKLTRKQEIIKRKDIGTGDLQQDVTEWFEIHSDKVKVKLWEEKLKKLAEKLKKPGGEEKLRIKIEKYLKQVPEKFSEGEDYKSEFRKQLPNDIIRKLKMMYLNPINTNVSVYRMESSKYCSRFKIENFRKAVLNWTKTLNIKKKDFLGRNVKKDDVFRYVADKLEPLVLDRPQSDSEYKVALKSNITDIVVELPLVVNSHNKDFYLNKLTENLVNDIFSIESKFPSTYIQPTIKETKEFVKDEITFFLEKSRVAISTKRMEYLETELIDILLDLTDITDIDNYVVDDITTLFKDVGKLPEYKAKYFTNLLLKDYKEFFFRESFFQVKGHSKHRRPDVYSDFQNASDMVDYSETSFDNYTQQLVEEINKWITKLNISSSGKNFIEVIVKDLASDIVDRHKYLLLNPSTKGTHADELEHLKFQIFKWTNKLVGKENIAVLEHAQELMDEINNIPKPSLQSASAVSQTILHDTDKQCDNKSYIDILTDQIYDWYRELPIDIQVSQDESLNKQVIKVLAQEIEKGLSKKEDGVIDKEVGKWTKNVFNEKLNDNGVEHLKNIITNVPYIKENRSKDPKHEKVLIRSYEDIVDKWIDTIPIAPKKERLFTNNKNEFVHEIAVKICKIKNEINHLPAEVVENKLQEELSHWLKKLPLHIKVDKQNYRDKYVKNLVKNIQTFDVEKSIETQRMVTNEEFVEGQLEQAVLKWLKKLPLYRNKSLEEKEHQESIIKELANKINGTVGDGDPCLHEDIIEHIRLLDPNQNENLVQNTACQLNLYLQKLNMLNNKKVLSQRHNKKEDFLFGIIEAWLENLPLNNNITEISIFKNKKLEFIASMKRLISSGSDNAIIKKVIVLFMRTLPISRNKIDDVRYLNQEAFKLIQSLTIVPVGDIPRQPPLKSDEVIYEAIKEWIDSLPLKSVHCPRELRFFIEDMSSVITTLLLDPEHSKTEKNDARLHREIVKFLRRFPLRHESATESNISRMAGELAKTLNDIRLNRDNDCTMVNNVTVYGFSLENTNTTNNDFSIQSIKESDINENLDRYTKQLVQQIGEWFDNLNLPDVHEEGYKEVVINDLAGDIVDRHKYLELNPDSTNTEEDELEHLKYQIFKWINKLVGEENFETIGHADDLMRRVNKIPVPMLVRPQDKRKAGSLVRQRNSSESSTSPEKKTNTRQPVSDPHKFGSSTGRGSFKESPSLPQATLRRMNSPADGAHPNSSTSCSQNLSLVYPPPDEGTKEAVYDKYQKIFREKCNALPIDDSSPQNAKLAELAKTAIYNAIVKTFFNLKADPEIENDYGYFEFMLEEKIEELLDVLPQSGELVNRRHAWKLDILKNAIDMLDQLHSLSDRPSFRQRVRIKFNRKFAKDLELEQCFLLQQGFLAEVADAYILETNYKEKDPLKANIYKNRLMKKVDDLANHLAKEHNVGFRFFKKAQLARIAMNVLEQVPIPHNGILQEEAEEIQLADEVEKWYNELPTKPLGDDTEWVLRKRMIDLLAKKLYDVQKRIKDQDPYKEARMKHEISQFLERRAQLQENQDLNINFMVDELNNRLKNKWLKEPINYNEFEKDKPLSSTFAHVDNADFLAPLMDAATSTGLGQGYQEPIDQGMRRDQGYFIQSGHPMQGVGQVHTSQRTSLYGDHGIANEMGQNQELRNSIRGGHAGLLPKGNKYADNSSISNHIPGQSYISQQEAAMHSMDPNISRHVSYGTRMSQAGPSKGYVSQQQAPIHTMRQEPVLRKSINGVYLDASQFGPNQQSPNMSHLNGRQVGSPGQTYIAQQSPHLMQNMTHTSPKNGREALRTSQRVAGPREQSINQSLGQNVLTSQMELQGQFLDQNMPSHIQGQYGLPGQTLFVPNHQGPQGLSPTDFSGYLGSRGPTPSHGAATAQVDPGASLVGDDFIDGGFHVKCRCLEDYQRRRRCYDERNARYKPYKSPY